MYKQLPLLVILGWLAAIAAVRPAWAFETLALCAIGANGGDTFAFGPGATDQGPGSASCFGDGITPPFNARVVASAEAEASAGLLHVTAESTWSPQGFGPDTTSTAFASWQDEVTIGGASLHGPSHLRVGYFVEGFLDATGNGVAEVDFKIDGRTQFIKATLPTPVHPEFGIGAVGFVGDALINFTPGIPFTLSGSLLVSTFQVGGIGSGFGQALFLNTAGWGGILEVLDQDGHVVTDYTLQSAAGVDWRISQQPVPLPSASLAFVCGCVSLLTLTRTRKS